jgi:hypothetical protein
LAVITWLPPVADHFQHQRCCLPRKAPSSFCYSALHVFAYPPSRWSSGRLNPALSRTQFPCGSGQYRIRLEDFLVRFDAESDNSANQVESTGRKLYKRPFRLASRQQTLRSTRLIGHKFKTLTNKNQPYQRKCCAR